jgi:hypothetical protein
LVFSSCGSAIEVLFVPALKNRSWDIFMGARNLIRLSEPKQLAEEPKLESGGILKASFRTQKTLFLCW